MFYLRLENLVQKSPSHWKPQDMVKSRFDGFFLLPVIFARRSGWWYKVEVCGKWQGFTQMYQELLIFKVEIVLGERLVAFLSPSEKFRKFEFFYRGSRKIQIFGIFAGW